MATTDEYLYFKNREPSEDDELLMSATDDSRIMFGPTSGLGGGVQMPEGMNEAQQMNYLREILRGEWNQRELSESSGLGELLAWRFDPARTDERCPDGRRNGGWLFAPWPCHRCR
mgnify:CR=1 FL=1